MRDEHGFAEFAAERGGTLRRQALLLTGEPRRAARLTERALAETARRWSRLAGPAAAEEHARRVLAVAAARRAPARATHYSPEEPALAGPGVAAASAGLGDGEVVWRGLASLPPRRRVVLVLRFEEGLDDGRIGARLGLPAETVAGERQAGLAALRSILLRRGRPEDLLPGALADPTRDLPPRPGPVPAVPRQSPRRRLLVAGGAVLALLAVGAAVLVPALGDDVEADPLPAAAPPAGGLDWPTRGPLAGDQDLLRAALRAWADGVPAAQRPKTPAVLYAGSPDGSRVVLLQGADAAGLGWAAEVADSGGTLALRRVEPLGRAAPLLAVSAGDTSAGAGTAVRLLAPPGTTGALLVRDPDLAPGAPLRRLAVDADGLSEPLDPGTAGVPVVVVTGGTDPAVAGSGLVVGGRLSVLTGTVEIGASSLPLVGSTDVRPVWYDDGALVAGKLGGPVVLAAAGPVLATTVRVGGRTRRLESRTYEARRAGTRVLATVLRVDGAAACLETLPLGPVGAQPSLPVVARRCLPPGARDGALHVVAGPQVVEVRLRLPGGAGSRRPRALTLRRPAGQPAGTGFVTLTPVTDLAARGGSGEAYQASGRVVARIILGPSRGPRG